ncbi:MAG: hypothetical protein MZU95_16290 [Desulfomicrobium escambiense]|nr:hypothetical protein [Desulfomicrobium escambiense]
MRGRRDRRTWPHASSGVLKTVPVGMDRSRLTGRARSGKVGPSATMDTARQERRWPPSNCHVMSMIRPTCCCGAWMTWCRSS